MTQDQHDLLLMRGTIAGLPESDRKAIEAAAQELRQVVARHDEPGRHHGLLALALVGAELAVKD